jgi:hypothetical protein
MSLSLPSTLVAIGLLLPGTAMAQSAKVADLAWLTGSRRMVIDSTVIEEQWTAAASNAIFGVGRTVKGARVVAFEFLRIQARGDTLYYIAQPNGAPPTHFRLTSWDGQAAVFENPAHDFPKRVLYWRLADGSVRARVDGGEGVARGAEEFHFRPEEG